MTITLLISLCIFFAVSGVSLNVALGRRKIAELRDRALCLTTAGTVWPRVSVIVSACNEAATIEPALHSLLQIDYPNLEIIAINDRSTDDTAAILDRLSLAYPALQVIHLQTLPSGWLGKNHALACGAKAASGEFLLFTDADAVFAPDAVSRAIAYCQTHEVDHLALLFDVVAPTRLLQMMITSFVTGVMAKFQPWKVKDSPRHFIGIGGFNMVRTRVYRHIGGHQAIALAVLDDLMLGHLIKRSGFVQHVLMGTEMVVIEWYANTGELIKGMEKNIFTAFDYSIAYLAIVSAASALARIWPWIALFTVSGPAWWIYMATILVSAALTLDLLIARRWPLSNLLFAPAIPIIELAMWWRGCLLTYIRGGIRWRGTFYPLSQIRQAHRVLQRAINRLPD